MDKLKLGTQLDGVTAMGQKILTPSTPYTKKLHHKLQTIQRRLTSTTDGSRSRTTRHNKKGA
jgi:hypothetical protein